MTNAIKVLLQMTSVSLQTVPSLLLKYPLRGTITTTLGSLAVAVSDVFVVNFVVYKKGLVQFSQLEANSNAKS
jgi:hypothetical protein